jgi:regulator of nucleoside diphosphate kinase
VAACGLAGASPEGFTLFSADAAGASVGACSTDRPADARFLLNPVARRDAKPRRDKLARARRTGPLPFAQENSTMEALTPERTLTNLDHVRLTNLLRRNPGATASTAATRGGDIGVADILQTAHLVTQAAVDPDVVTMHSQVLVGDLSSERKFTLILCYPQDASPVDGFVSVLSPVGSSLLGLRAGDIARWRTPAGTTVAAKVLAVLFQPEAHGDYAS